MTDLEKAIKGLKQRRKQRETAQPTESEKERGVATAIIQKNYRLEFGSKDEFLGWVHVSAGRKVGSLDDFFRELDQNTGGKKKWEA